MESVLEGAKTGQLSRESGLLGAASSLGLRVGVSSGSMSLPWLPLR